MSAWSSLCMYCLCVCRSEVAEREQVLRTKVMRERDNMKMVLRHYRFTLLRIWLPDGLIVQGVCVYQTDILQLIEFTKLFYNTKYSDTYTVLLISAFLMPYKYMWLIHLKWPFSSRPLARSLIILVIGKMSYMDRLIVFNMFKWSVIRDSTLCLNHKYFCLSMYVLYSPRCVQTNGENS